MAKKKKSNSVVVDRKFMTDLARRIYDSKNRKFLYLCDGTLQNGPDPTDEDRPMHCGLGELYFAMTGSEPLDDGVGEEDVIDLAVELSTLPKRDDRRRELKAEIEAAAIRIRALGLSDEITDNLIYTLEDTDIDSVVDEEFDDIDNDFRSTLDEIPGVNDSCGGTCEIDVYRTRAKRVAQKLREAAKLLPR